MRDNALANALIKDGHEAELLPMLAQVVLRPKVEKILADLQITRQLFFQCSQNTLQVL